MTRNWNLLMTASEDLRPPANRHVSESWIQILQPQSNLQMTEAPADILPAIS